MTPEYSDSRQMPLPLILASASPRRQELLARLAIPFAVRVPQVDETPQALEAIRDYVQRMAFSKAAAVQCMQPRPCVVIGADTVVEVGGELLLKPLDVAHARTLLERLSGREHLVHTAVAILSPGGCRRKLVSSEVVFRRLREPEMAAYCRLGEGLDKAGGYAIQGLGAAFVAAVRGSYTAVVGLPLCEVAEELQDLGYRCWLEPEHE